ncbi:MAG: DUF2723 domain-containing protein [Candidatus Eisenbacteria bacterium]|uniref:DUF2723 domain-containing protein n=1 Tax=Eiseniibacteriota bacterium TaxID=2212470 RepID=A0A948S0C1_UNCEI|nr:DUF2723 domain-containing protein [Candidatus Eisenbacteria bacterium]MBU1950396.1 DUF2723 domain-containing protein [Candidatus Eisenbacteria bacterium]MBU2692983.1 DUF2723 domain-containing protein [Candidatus Eisenbacteria bacterium]
MKEEASTAWNAAPNKIPVWKRLLTPISLGGLAVLVVTQIVYLATLNITCPFWDSGEFIASSHILGVPHPPGTPMYVLIGRLFSLIPIWEVATRVNYLSAISSSVAAVFVYLVTIQFFRRWPGVEEAWETPSENPAAGRFSRIGWGQWMALAAGLVAGFFTAFGRTYWDNAVEAEVYGLSGLVMILTVWMALKWADGVESFRKWSANKHERGDRGGAVSPAQPGMLVLIVYLLFLSIGIHMGTFIVLPAIVLFVAVIDSRTVLNFRFLGSMVVAGLSILLFFILNQQTSIPMALAISLGVYGLVVVFSWKTLGRRNYAFWFFCLGFLGVSVHLYLFIRSHLDPGINEADPSTWEAFWLVLTRDQYKPPNPFIQRQTTFAIQFTKHFWRYAHDQYNLGILPGGLKLYLPYALGLMGVVAHWIREKKGAIFMTVLYLSTSLFLIWYLNFRENEVRDRDYFFVASYQFFAVWIGLGVGELFLTLKDSLNRSTSRFILPVVGVVAVLLSLMPAKAGYFEHDRSKFWIARDYASNMLTPLEPDAILFTNGDNDTFPLWYIQEVEYLRRDIRVVNLSLLQTQWYIRQLRDYEPKVDLGWDDKTIDALRPYIDRDGEVVWVNDICVHRIIDVYYGKRPIYIAVTVPDLRGLKDRLVQEGLVFSVRKPGEGGIDVELTQRNLGEVFSYRGLLDENGKHDDSIYKDETASKLVQNYASGWVGIAHRYVQRGGDEENRRLALEALEKAKNISPTYPGTSYTLGVIYYRMQNYAEAESTFMDLVKQGDGDVQVLRLLGLSQEAQGKNNDALRSYESALNMDPADRESYVNLFQFLVSLDQPRLALDILDRWLRFKPDDAAFLDARRIIVETLDSTGVAHPR